MSKPANPRRVGEREALATATAVRGSAYKLNLVAGLIRGRPAGEAVTILKFSRKAMAVDVSKCLQSAIANAENNHNLDVDRLVVKEASVGRGLVMKRFTPRARGRAARIEKPFSKLRIVVHETDPAEAAPHAVAKGRNRVQRTMPEGAS